MNWVEAALYDLYNVAHRLITGRILWIDEKDRDVDVYFDKISGEASSKSADSFSRGLEQLTLLIDAIEARRFAHPDLTLE